MPVAPLIEIPAAPFAPPPRLAGGGGGPGSGDDDGDGDGGGGGGDDPGRDELPISRQKLALVFLLLSLSVLFTVTLFVALLLRRQAAVGHPGVVPAFPPILWADTAVLLASSFALRGGVRAIGAGDRAALTRGLAATTGLGVAFLGGQGWAWHGLLAAGVGTGSGTYATVFYTLTGLHALHVVGGIVLLAVCLVRALRQRYSAGDHMGVDLCEIYWHFLGGVWVVLVLLLLVML
jgi:cytochrome c oxidase subunit 3